MGHSSGFMLMGTRRAAMLVCSLMIACCAPAPGPAAHLTIAEIEPIITPLAYRELWGKKCGDASIVVKTEFIADLKAAGAPADLVKQAEAVADKITAAEKDTLNEYVCTVELSESTEKNATAAQKAWAELKSRRR